MARRKEIEDRPDYDGSTSLADPKYELFCQLFTTNTSSYYWGQGTNCYIYAFQHRERIDEMLTLAEGPAAGRSKGKFKTAAACFAEAKRIERACAASATRLLTVAKIKARCNHLLDILSEEVVVDRELQFVIQQRRDLASKVQAIRHYDQRSGRIQEKLKVEHTFLPIGAVQYVKPEKPIKA